MGNYELRRQWLVAGPMEMQAGAPFAFVWRNDELTSPPGQRPPGASHEPRMQSRIFEPDPPHKLVIAWGDSGEVAFALSQKGADVLLTVTHRRLPDRAIMLKASAGWHMQLDILVAHATGKQPEPFWDGWSRLRQDTTGGCRRDVVSETQPHVKGNQRRKAYDAAHHRGRVKSGSRCSKRKSS